MQKAEVTAKGPLAQNKEKEPSCGSLHHQPRDSKQARGRLTVNTTPKQRVLWDHGWAAMDEVGMCKRRRVNSSPKQNGDSGRGGSLWAAIFLPPPFIPSVRVTLGQRLETTQVPRLSSCSHEEDST